MKIFQNLGGDKSMRVSKQFTLTSLKSRGNAPMQPHFKSYCSGYWIYKISKTSFWHSLDFQD